MEENANIIQNPAAEPQAVFTGNQVASNDITIEPVAEYKNPLPEGAPTPEIPAAKIMESLKEQPAELPKPAGTLFESIAYNNPADVSRFIENMNVNDSALVLLTAASFAHKKGILNLLESEVLSKAIRIFTTPRQPMVSPEEKIVQPVPPSQPAE